jgi:predicted lipid-binding transport protein (Tim44 family)
VIVRGPKAKAIRIVALDAGAEPPTMTIQADIEGPRYIEDRDTAEVVTGSPSRPSRFTERWTMALDGDARQPWRIAAVATAVARA